MAESLGQVDIVLKPDASALKAVGGGMMGKGKGIGGLAAAGGAVAGGALIGGRGGGGPEGKSRGMGKVLKTALVATGIFVGFKLLKGAISGFLTQFDAFAEKMAGFNPHMAMASVTKFTGQLQRDLSMASRIGKQYLEYVQMQEEVKNIFQPIKEMWAVIKIGAMKLFMKTVRWAAEAIEGIIMSILEGLAAGSMFIRNLKNVILQIVYPFMSMDTWKDLEKALNKFEDEIQGAAAEILKELKNKRDDDDEKFNNEMMMKSLEHLTDKRWMWKHQIPGGGTAP